MAKEIVMKVVLAVIGSITTGLIGYLVAKIKEYKSALKKKAENEKVQNVALLTLLQSNLTNTFLVYNEMKKVPDYIHKNWTNLFSIYKELGGNDYCDTLKAKMDNWEIIRTDIL